MCWLKFKAKLLRQFRANRDCSTTELLKDRKSNMVMQLIFLSLTILFTSSLFIIPFNSLAVFERMAFLGVVVSGIALGFGLMLQFRVYEVEVNFELRLREMVAEVKDWQA